jgi:5'-phosphate synthase pdxT subunit
LASFEAQLEMPELSNPSVPFPAIFIRAPALHSFAQSGKADSSESAFRSLCSLPPDLAADAPPSDGHLGPANDDALRMVAVRKGKKLATSFHPELSPDLRIHEYFVRRVCME